MGEKLGFTLVEVERGRVVFEGTPDPSHFNPLGAVHGGYAATLLDSAWGIAVHSTLGPKRGHTTLELGPARSIPATSALPVRTSRSRRILPPWTERSPA